MIDHYNAFISYKHAPEDNRVAEAVQKGLERFHIPKKIQKKTGMKRIQRVFRDKDELPITSNLSGTIAYALEHSDYLIVICSTNTKESMWVPREIEYFLRNHTKQQILTVLVNGEPNEVIPPMLQYEDRVYNGAQGQQMFRFPLEPLSCDYRLPMRKANHVELPRLASCLIGCSYDELMNRRRQYKMQRMALGFAGALAILLGFSGYMAYSRYRIHKTYLESLRNQSKYLANESEKLLDEEQRISAIQLALEAMPKDEKDDRPVTPDAISALNAATLAYVSESTTNINAEWNYQLPNTINKFYVSPEANTLAALDNSGVLIVWNTASHEEILHLDTPDQKISGILYLDNDTLLEWNYEVATAYDLKNGKEKWSYTFEESYSSADSFVVVDKYLYILLDSGNLAKINIADGKAEKNIKLDMGKNEGITIRNMSVSPNGTKLAFSGFVDWESYTVGVIDLNSGKVTFTDTTEDMTRDVIFADDNNVMAAYSKDYMNSSMSFGNKSVLSADHSVIKCLKASDLSEVWSADFVCNDVMVQSGFLSLPESKSVCYFCGNIATTYDLKSGEVKYENNVNDSIIDASDRDGDGVPVYITEDGGLAYPAADNDNSVAYSKYLTDNISKAVVNNGVYVNKQMACEIIYYGTDVYDKSWKEIKEGITLSSIYNDTYMDETVLAIITSENDKPGLLAYNLEDPSKIHQLELGGDSAYSYDILGTYDGKLYIASSAGGSYNLVIVNMATGDMDSIDTFETYYSPDKVASFSNGKLTYTYSKDYKDNYVVVQNIKNSKTEEYQLPTEDFAPTMAPVYFEKSNIIYYADEAGDYFINAKSGKVQEMGLPASWVDTSMIAASSDEQSFAITDKSQIQLVTPDGSTKFTISCPGVEPTGMAFYKPEKAKEEQLLVVYNDGTLYRYSATTGDVKGKSEISYYYGGTDSAEFIFSEDGSNLYIQSSTLTNIIDINSWTETTYIERCFGYHKKTDRFLTYSNPTYEEFKIGYYDRYSNEELVEKAKEITGGTELSDELKTRYGLSDED